MAYDIALVAELLYYLDARAMARCARDIAATLRPGGVLAVWSAGPDRNFTQRLRQAGFAVEEKTVRAGPEHVRRP